MRTIPPRDLATADPLHGVLDRYLATGDESAIEEIVRETRPRLLSAARRIGGLHDAEDAVQAAYLSLVRRRGRPLDAPVLPWLLTAVIRTAYRRKAVLRRDARIAERLGRPSPEDGPVVAGMAPIDAMDAAETADRLRGAVSRLSARYRDPLVLRHLHGLSTAEVARLLDLPEATVRTRLHRGAKCLRSRFSPRLVAGLLAVPWFVVDSFRDGFAIAGGVMKVNATVVGLLVLAVAVGAAGARFLLPSPAEGDLRDARAEVDRLKADVERLKASRLPDPVAATLEAAKAKDLLAQVERLQAQLAEERAAKSAAAARPEVAMADAAMASEAPPTAGSARFAYAEFRDPLSEVDWNLVGSSLNAIVPLIRSLGEGLERGEPISSLPVGDIQRHNGPLITVALKIADRIPGSGVNGSFTHPVFMVNAIAATLDAAKLPLSPSQTTALDRVGRTWADAETRRLAGYDERTFGLQKVVDEVEQKDRFFEAAFAVLTTEQRDALSPPAVRGRIQADLFSSGLIWAAFVRPTPSPDRATFAAAVESRVNGLVLLPESGRAEVRAIVADWVAGWPKETFEGETDPMSAMGMVTSAFALDCAKRHVALLQRISSQVRLDEAGAKKVRDHAVVSLPLRQVEGN